jgi:hypothetical protein
MARSISTRNNSCKGKFVDISERKRAMFNRVFEGHKKRMGQRLLQSRELFGHEVVIGDIHTHSVYSDGRCTVEELKKYSDLAEMDFIFVTDHDSVDQEADCKNYDNVWHGQEPACNIHHIGLLSPQCLFEPEKESFTADLEAANALSPFAWIAHPTGWGPEVYYEEQGIDLLFEIEDDFAMEVLNGVLKITDVFDPWQERSVLLWDRLLSAGRKVTPVAGSDAHFAAGVGCAWTGCLGAQLNLDSVLNELNAGHTIASEGPLATLACQGKKQGDTIKVKNNSKLEFHIKAADSIGLAEVKMIRNGNVEKIFDPCRGFLFEDIYVTQADPGDIYFRLECVSVDFKHVYTSPIYIEAI